jgi:hypothetical protein
VCFPNFLISSDSREKMVYELGHNTGYHVGKEKIISSNILP